MIVIKMPSNLNLDSAINFHNLLEVGESEKYVFDYKNLSTVEPFAMLYVGSKVREFFNNNKDKSQISDTNFKGKSYAAHMGYFQSVYLNFGYKPGEAPGSSTYVPITRIRADFLQREAAKNREHVGETIEAKAENLASILSRGEVDLKEYLTYSIRELIRNIVEHNLIIFGSQGSTGQQKI